MVQQKTQMTFVLDERKAAQAAAVLLKTHGHSMSKDTLVKLLYLADRRSLQETGSSITGDRLVSLQHGPALSTILDVINRRPVAPSFEAAWEEYVSPAIDNQVELQNPDPELDELSPYDVRLLQAIYDEFGQRSFAALQKYTHDLPEWQDPHGSCLPIDPTTILRNAGWEEEEIKAAAQDARGVKALDDVLTRPR